MSGTVPRRSSARERSHLPAKPFDDGLEDLALFGFVVELVAETRREVQRSLGEATERLQAQASVARTQLERDAEALASTVVERVLGRKAS